MVQGERRGGNGGGPQHDYRGMPEREHEAHGDGTFALVHQLASDVVDCCDVVGIDCVAEAKAVGQKCGSQE